METKEDWINKTMESLDGVNRAESDPLLYEKVLGRIQHHNPNGISFQSRMVWRAAAVILILITFNVFTLVYFSRSPNNGQNTVESVANEYFSYLDSINF